MTTLILIAQTFFGATAYEYGPFPDLDSCEKSAVKHIERIEADGKILKVISDCRVLYPELTELIKFSGIDGIE